MLFSKEYLSHGYADRRMGVLDSSVWRILMCTFTRGGWRVDIPHLGFGGGGGVLSLKQVIQFHHLAS